MNTKIYFTHLKKAFFNIFIFYLTYVLIFLIKCSFNKENFLIKKIFQFHLFTVNNIIGFTIGLLVMTFVLEFFSKENK